MTEREIQELRDKMANLVNQAREVNDKASVGTLRQKLRQPRLRIWLRR